jgi:hypothetical protein
MEIAEPISYCRQPNIRRQPRHDIADARGFKVARRKPGDVIKKALAQIPSDAFAQPGHQIESCGGADRQGAHQNAHHQRGAIQGDWPAGKAIINQMLETLAECQGQPRRQQQRRNRGKHARPIGFQQRQQQPKGGEARARSGRHVSERLRAFRPRIRTAEMLSASRVAFSEPPSQAA